MTSPIELVRRDTGELAALACGKCGMVQGLAQPELARRLVNECCATRVCETCGKQRPAYSRHCDECDAKRRAEIEAAAIAKAERVSLADYLAEMGEDAMICTVRLGDEGAYRVATDAADDGIAWAWACTRQSWGTLDALSIAETVCDEMYEDAIERLDVDGLQKTLDAWLEAQPDPGAWMVDERRIVVLAEVLR